jgi:metal-responsive CopG/Arc/MetJ family transcriptional regulator
MPKRNDGPPPAEPKLAPVITMVPLSVRNQVDQLAQQANVSRSEIGRRALQQYVEREGSE